MTGPSGRSPTLSADETAAMLGLPVAAVASLAAAGYLTPAGGNGTAHFAAAEVKAFLARNADGGSGNLLVPESSDGADAELLAALGSRTKEMAARTYDIFCATFPEALSWRELERQRFVDQARARFEAILAVAGEGAAGDPALIADLEEVGAAAARAGSSLPQLLVTLRISRDLVVQTAVELADERGRHWSMSLALLLTRVLPAMDRLTDAIAKGYWDSVLFRDAEQKARYQHVVEHSSDGVYEVDLEGRVQYANPSLAVISGMTADSLDGALLDDIFRSTDGAPVADRLLRDEPDGGGDPLELEIVRPDGVRRRLDVRAGSRHRHGELVGFQGVVRDVTTARDLEDDKNEFLALLTSDLRQPLTTVLGLGATLEAHAGELPTDRISRMGGAIRLHAERISRLADDLYDISRLQSQSLLLNVRAVDLAAVVEGALASVAAAVDVGVAVPANTIVLADPHRLGQVVANLVENAITYGAAPVVVSAVTSPDGTVELSVLDRGPGVPPSLAPALFNRLRLLSRRESDARRGTGLGLSLVRGLVEAMGGRVWYQDAPGGGADFRICLPSRTRMARAEPARLGSGPPEQ